VGGNRSPRGLRGSPSGSLPPSGSPSPLTGVSPALASPGLRRSGSTGRFPVSVGFLVSYSSAAADGDQSAHTTARTIQVQPRARKGSAGATEMHRPRSTGPSDALQLPGTQNYIAVGPAALAGDKAPSSPVNRTRARRGSGYEDEDDQPRAVAGVGLTRQRSAAAEFLGVDPSEYKPLMSLKSKVSYACSVVVLLGLCL
jgi:hypothetical protein